MIQTIAFIFVSALTAVSGAAIFVSRRLIHSVIALTIAFFGSALVFLLMEQAFIALLQLFIFVGGLSTYLIVAVASEDAGFSINWRRFLPLLALVVIGLLPAFMLRLPSPPATSADFAAAAGTALSYYYPMLFAMVILLFSSVMGSILVIKRFARLVS